MPRRIGKKPAGIQDGLDEQLMMIPREAWIDREVLRVQERWLEVHPDDPLTSDQMHSIIIPRIPASYLPIPDVAKMMAAWAKRWINAACKRVGIVLDPVIEVVRDKNGNEISVRTNDYSLQQLSLLSEETMIALVERKALTGPTADFGGIFKIIETFYEMHQADANLKHTATEVKHNTWLLAEPA